MEKIVGTEPKGIRPLLYKDTSSHLSHFRPASRGWSTSGSTSRRSPSTTATTTTATRKRTKRRWTRDGWRRLFWIWPPASVTRHWNKSSQKNFQGSHSYLSLFKRSNLGLFLFLFSLFKQTIQFLQQINVKKCLYIQYMILGFEPTTYWTWVVSHNH